MRSGRAEGSARRPGRGLGGRSYGVPVYETPAEVEALQRLLDTSRTGATAHLRGIVGDDRTLTAEDLVALLTGMRVLTVATVTARGEPRISALDGHFVHGTWTFSTDGGAAKARHIQARPAVSVAHVDGETFALFMHGEAQQVRPDDRGWGELLDHWTRYYGESPLGWGDDIRLYRLAPTWAVGFAADRAALRADRGPG